MRRFMRRLSHSLFYVEQQPISIDVGLSLVDFDETVVLPRLSVPQRQPIVWPNPGPQALRRSDNYIPRHGLGQRG